MSNKELIERLRSGDEIHQGNWSMLDEAIEALEAADKRIAELEAERDAFHMNYRMKCDKETKELERKLAVAREALSAMWLHYKSLVDSGDAGNWTPEDEPVCKQAVEALAQIGGEDAS